MLAAWQIAEAIANASIGFTKLPNELLEMDGMSSRRGRILLNELCDFPCCSYLEVGTFKASTVLAASYGHCGSFISIDNFSGFGGARESARRNQERWRKECGWRLIEADAWTVEPEAVGPINVFFYDGEHTETDQVRAFTHFHPAFENTFIAIVDDWNASFVRRGTRKAFRELNYTVLEERELYSCMNGDTAGWWNGMYVALVQKS